MTPSPHAPSPNYLPVRPDWLAQWHEPTLEPALPIVDAHHHFYDRPGWRYLCDEFLGDAAQGHRVQASVYMQAMTRYRSGGSAALAPVGETEYVAAATADLPPGSPKLAQGIVGHADLRLGAEVREVLEAHLAAGQGRFRGIRHLCTWDADSSLANPLTAAPPGLLLDDRYRAGVAEMARLGLSFDAWLFFPQVPDLLDLARRFETVPFIVNHCGGVVRIGAYAEPQDEVFARWRAQIESLARLPNVTIKLGGLGMRVNGFGFHERAAPPSSQLLADTWRPWILACIDAFGPDRCMFESNFPVDKGSCTYGAVWNAFKRLSAGFSRAEREALFSGTARRVYRLDPPEADTRSPTPPPTEGDTMNTRHVRALAGSLLAATALALPVWAQTWPAKPVTVVVPYAVGGTTDIVARIVATQVGNTLGQPLVVENRAGGGGNIGWGSVARAEADGHTVLTTEMSFTIAPALGLKQPFDPRKDFTHVVTVAAVPHVLVINPGMPAATIQEFIKLAKANPGKYFYGSGGNGTNTHLGGELLKAAAGIDLVHVPYKGAGAVLQDLMGGQVQALVTTLATAMPHIKSGKLRALMVASPARSPLLPDVPSAAEAGLPGMSMDFWVGLAVPAGTPAAAVERLNQAVVAALRTDESRRKLAELGLEPVANSPAAAAQLVNSEMQRWQGVVRSAGIKAD